ncbi:PGAP1-like protein [Nocardia amikacinitolerans]|nr:PGAP1-like protein [Nocardia amikacinitolerans]
MARVVCVHGIGAQVSGGDVMLKEWLPALNSGLSLAGAAALAPEEVAAGFYGDLFRPPGQFLSVREPWYGPGDVQPGWEQELLVRWWEAAAQNDAAVRLPGDRSLARTPVPMQAILHQLSKSRFFAGVAVRGMVGNVKQVRRYLFEPELRERIRDRVKAVITADTRVVVAHSLGSVVAYEALCSTPDHRVAALVTLGSPLGIPNLIFDRLDPPPNDGVAAWPGRPELVWTNIADSGDIVALVKRLDPLFGATFAHRVWDALVHNGVHAHSAVPYLTDALTGRAIADGLHAH